MADCSKGFNNSDPKWLEACLDAAKTPPDILNVVDALSLNKPILSLDGIEFDPVQLISGLCQGGPASGILFEISVDPLLISLEQLEGVVRRSVRTKAADGRVEETDEAIVSGFVDDWSVEFEGPKALNTDLKKIAKNCEILKSLQVRE